MITALQANARVQPIEEMDVTCLFLKHPVWLSIECFVFKKRHENRDYKLKGKVFSKRRGNGSVQLFSAKWQNDTIFCLHAV